MVTEAVWNHPSPLLPQVNSKGFFTLMQLHIVCVQHRHLTTPLQYLMIYTRKIPVGEVGFYFFGCLVLVCVCACVCACVRRFFRTDLKVPERARSPSPDGSLR